MDFASAYAHGFARVAALAPVVRSADPAANAAAISAAARRLPAGVAVAVFPELSLTGYALDDLFLQDALLAQADAALRNLAAASGELGPLLVVGAPVPYGNRLLNAAVVLHRGRVLGIVPKSHVPTYREFYERRWFAPGDDVRGTAQAAGQEAPIGPDLIFSAADVPHLDIHVELCEDMWTPVPPSARAALAGAAVLVNLSGSPVTVGRAGDRRLLARSASLRCLAAYVYAAAGAGESSTDLAWDGQTFVYELGRPLAAGDRFAAAGAAAIADVDLGRIWQERLRTGTFDDNRRAVGLAAGPATAEGGPGRFRRVCFTLGPPAGDIGLRRPLDRFPFVPADPARLADDCYEAYNIQVAGLTQRLAAVGQPKPVIGVSGGLDSTHALIVAARAMDLTGRPRSDILAFTLPGFATSEATKANALALMEAVGATSEAIDIQPAARQMLADLGHPFADGRPVYDVTFENVQAGLRTDYLFRAANQRGGLVIGTGDLSELALGWCTYGVGDQMSHYAVNQGVPKTLIQHLIRWVVSERHFGDAANAVFERVLAQEISPELVPAAAGAFQSTEDFIGPYALHDFFLYHLLRAGAAPSKIAFLAGRAWGDAAAAGWPAGWPEDRKPAYDLAVIRHWLEQFLRRFFASQFKRSALPNGPKVSAGGTLSPRGDWRMPSDASPAAWLAELDAALPAAAVSPPGL
ncbi:MAG: NAD(+) synthase [Propionibacteriaceae bacterium]|jgi:NAD+ synthase (glutamine-hydrolysing)|nr:NAD(+) synthase [Propionibacteriaceae bacterium]